MQRPLPVSTSPTSSRRTSGEHKRRSLDNGARRPSGASESSLRYEYGGGGGAAAEGVEEGAETPLEERSNLAVRVREKDVGGEELKVRKMGGVGAEAPAPDILSDMERLQREVDELRDRYRRVS
jgi:hypothetical protein